MNEWKEKTLGEVTSYISKGIPPKYVEKPGSGIIRVLNQKCNRDFRISYSQSRLHNNAIKAVPESKMLRDYDVLINSTGEGTAGRVAQIMKVSEPTTFDGHMILIRPTADIDPLFYGYTIKAHQRQIEEFAEGSTGQTEINKRRLQDEVIVKYPVSTDKQRSIGCFLLNLDDKIRINEEINQNFMNYYPMYFL